MEIIINIRGGSSADQYYKVVGYPSNSVAKNSVEDLLDELNSLEFPAPSEEINDNTISVGLSEFSDNSSAK